MWVSNPTPPPYYTCMFTIGHRYGPHTHTHMYKEMLWDKIINKWHSILSNMHMSLCTITVTVIRVSSTSWRPANAVVNLWVSGDPHTVLCLTLWLVQYMYRYVSLLVRTLITHSSWAVSQSHWSMSGSHWAYFLCLLRGILTGTKPAIAWKMSES